MIQYTELPNGIRIVTENLPYMHTVSVGAFFAVGSRYETKEQNGISHLLEHMVFKRTKNRTAFDISREIEDVGGEINAFTAQNLTAFHAEVLKENTPLAIDIISDITQNAVIDAQDFQQERNVVLQELRMEKDDPAEMTRQRFCSTAYPNQPYGRPIIGSAKTLSALTREDVLNYMRTKYTANRLVISAAGNLDHDQIVDMCAEKFTHLPYYPYTNPEPAVYKGGCYCKKEAHEEAYINLGFEGLSKFHQDIYAEHILTTILCDGMSSRLFMELRENRGLVYSVSPIVYSNTENGHISIDISTDKKNVKRLMPVLIDELNRLPDSLTEEEINRAKKIEKTAFIKSLDKTDTRMASNASNIINHGRALSVLEELKGFDLVTKEQLERVARTIFSGKPTLSAIGPIDYLMPYSDILARLNNYQKPEPTPAPLRVKPMKSHTR